MSSSGPTGGGGSNPFEGLFGELARLLGSSSGPINWEIARQVAGLVAGGGQAEDNIDPIRRMRLEELTRIAEMHVNQQPGLELTVRQVQAVSHIQWASESLGAYEPVFERLAERLGSSSETSAPQQIDPTNPLAGMQQFMSPVLLGMQIGGMVGHMARRSLGRFDLPIPRPDTATIQIVPANLDEFAESWSLPSDELDLFLCTEEAVRCAVLAHPHVSARFAALIHEYVSGFQSDDSALESRFGELDINDPSKLTEALGDPETLLGAIQTPAQRTTLVHLSALVAVFVGYVDHVTARIASKTISSGALIAEASKRRRVEDTESNRLVSSLLGLEMSQAQFERGEGFINGVLTRTEGDETILERLWRSTREMPTPADVDAPGLWLERIDLPE